MRDLGMYKTEKRHPGMELLVGRNNVRKIEPRTEFVDKRSLEMEFIWKIAHMMQLADKRAPVIEFVGKRSF